MYSVCSMVETKGLEMHLKTFPEPILTRADIPAISPALTDVSSVFNPGATRWRGRELLALRVQDRGRRSYVMPAERQACGKIDVFPHVAHIAGLEKRPETIYHVYDPRLTVLDDELYMVFAADIDDACRLGIARCLRDDLSEFELISFDPAGDSRNGVLFPEKIGGQYVRLERPNGIGMEDGVTSGDTIFLATSDDLVDWKLQDPVMGGRWHFWDERIGSGPPPVRTEAGWLHLYHGIAAHFSSCNIYQGGAMLLDLDDPGKVLARTPMNLLEPRQSWELCGQVPNVVFPSGMVADGAEGNETLGRDALLRIYYGAADTVVGMAQGTVGDILDACEPV